MKKAIYATIFMTLLFFPSGPVAQELPRPFTGRIQTVDVAARMIAIMAEEKTIVFYISEDTSIKTDYGVNVPFAELKITMLVTVDYLKKGDDIYALSIKISTMPTGFQKGEEQTLCGRIQSVDVAAWTITVMGKGKTVVFQIFGDTKIKADSGENVPLAELKNGMLVTIDYIKKGNSNHPVSIQVSTIPKGIGKKQKGGKK